MQDLKTSVIINLAGNLARKSRKFGRSMQNMSKKGERSFSRLRQSASKNLNKIGNRYTSFLTGAAGIAAIRMVGNLERRFTRLGIQSKKSAEEMDALKRRIFETAQSPDIRIDPGQIISAIEAIVEKTGDLKFAEDSIRNIGLAIQATGAQGGAIGEILAEFQKMGITAPAEVLKALDTMNVQGKEGAFTLENLAALGPRVITAYTALGRTGTGALREMGAALQVIRQGTGSSEMAASAFEAVLRTISDEKRIKQLKAIGVEVLDSEGKFKSINRIIVDIVKSTGGNKIALGKIFDAEAIRAFNAAASEFKRTNSLASLDKFFNVFADGTTTINDSKRAANDFNASIESLNTTWKEFADKRLSSPLNAVTDAINFTNSRKGEDIIGGTIATIIDGGFSGAAKNSFETLSRLNLQAGHAIADPILNAIRGLFTDEIKSSVDINIKSDVPVSVKNLKSGSRNQVLNVDTGATMVTQ